MKTIKVMSIYYNQFELFFDPENVQVLVDLLYQVNTDDPTTQELVQLLELVQHFGWYKLDQKDDYECTTEAIDRFCNLLESRTNTLTKKQSVDLAIALRIGYLIQDNYFIRFFPR